MKALPKWKQFDPSISALALMARQPSVRLDKTMTAGKSNYDRQWHACNREELELWSLELVVDLGFQGVAVVV